MLNKSVTIVVIFIIITIALYKFYSFSTNKTPNLNPFLILNINESSLSLNPVFPRDIKDKIILRLKNEYCQACVETMLVELNNNIKLNQNNFVILSQFKKNRELKIFEQYSVHKVINIVEDILPLDTIAKSHVYFIKKYNDNEILFFEYQKGKDYNKFIDF